MIGAIDPTLVCAGVWLLLALVAVGLHLAELGARALGMIERETREERSHEGQSAA